MMSFIASNKVVALFVRDLLEASNEGLLSIMITKLEKSGACSVCIVTNTSSEDTVNLVAQSYSYALITTSKESTEVGKFHQK